MCHVKVCVSGYAARACSNSQTAYSIFVWMKAKNLVLLLPWHLVDLVHCKSLVDVFNTVVDPKKEKFAQSLQLQIAFEEVVCIEEFTNIGLFCKTIDRSGNRQPSANIGRNFKSCNLTEKQFVSKEINCSSLGPAGIGMTSNGGGAVR